MILDLNPFKKYFLMNSQNFKSRNFKRKLKENFFMYKKILVNSTFFIVHLKCFNYFCFKTIILYFLDANYLVVSLALNILLLP